MIRKHQSRSRSAQSIFLQMEALEARRVLTDVSGVIAADAVWTIEESPYRVVGDITVPAGIELAIEPGVLVQFQNGTGLTVNGRLDAEGSPFERIRFEPELINGRVITQSVDDRPQPSSEPFFR